jgi:acylphosphatase
MKKHYNLIITGKVQGVGYRFSCMEAAYKCGVKGFVRNKSNGNVYAEAEGAEEELAVFIAWCRRGPAWAQVTDVQIEEGELQHFDSFVISR